MSCRSCTMKRELNPAENWMTTITPGMSRMTIRSAILQFEADFIAMCREQPEAFEEVLTESPPLTHEFADGVYIRTITLPAGAIIIGKIHKHKHLNFITRGRVRCVTEGKGVEEITGPCTMISEAGTKRVLYAYEETVWTTVHRTDATTVEDAEKDAVAESCSAIGFLDPRNVARLEA